MAKENYIFLVGQVRKPPVSQKDSNGKIISTMFPLMTLRRNVKDEAGNYAPRWDKPLIMTTDPLILEKTLEIQVHDIVEVKGTIMTRNVKRSLQCPYCGNVALYDGMITVINPVYVGIRKNFDSDSEGYAELLQCAEISNTAKVIGRVCSPAIEVFRNDEGALGARYQIAINRKLYVTGTDPEDHSDYPWVYSYGGVAEEDQSVLQQGSMLYLDGYVHTMKFKQKTYCQNPECMEVFDFPNQSMNITPYACEYLENCNLPDPVQRNISRDEPMEYE